jgi:hypothetical protein
MDRQSIRQVPFVLAAWFRPGRITLSLAVIRRCAMSRLLVGCSLLVSAAMLLRGADSPDEPIAPKKIIPLFNGKDLSGLSTWLKDTKREDPRKVFRVTDGQIHISGDGFGYVGTTQAYQDYHLIVEFKWGKKTDGGKFVRNSGVLLHATGPDGGAGAWMSCIECQLAQGCVGDLIPIRGRDADNKVIPVQFTSEVVLGKDNHPRWSTGGKPQVFTGKQLWWSKHDPDFKELLDTRGKDDVESKLGDWTKVECVCRGKGIEVWINRTKVNECYDTFPAAGRILLQSEGFELFVRTFELHPLGR